VDTAVLAGHSMGAYVAALAARPAPGPGHVGGAGRRRLAFSLPPGTDVDAAVTSVLGPAVARLEATFATRRSTASSGGSTRVRLRLDAGARRVPDARPHRRRARTGSSCIAEAVRVDGADMFAGPEATAAFHRMPVPGVLLWAGPRAARPEPGDYYTRRTPPASASRRTRAGHEPLLDLAGPGAPSWPNTSSGPPSTEMGLTIGVDIGGTKIAAGVVDESGQVCPAPAGHPVT
jgi:pimeloyl-ACP methyl ester carboxylesterase